MRRVSLAAAVIIAIVFCALSVLLPGLVADTSTSALQTSATDREERVGQVNFPTSCAESAQSGMEKGLALLHSFQYQEAEQEFTTAAEVDPQCALAYWGKAMALYQQLWDFPSPRTLAEGRQDLVPAEKLGVEDKRVRAYIEAAATFYQERAGLGPTARVQAYSSAMEKLYREQPQDNEAGELYALSLISLAQMGVQDLGNRRKAIAILDPIFAEYPDNPGAAHYLIHACDVPELARHGLAAARVYAKIAPDSAHALHMPSHIFRRLGLWQEVIQSNLVSAGAAAKATREHRGDASYQFHAMDFLDYAYLQSGQETKARNLVQELKEVPQGGESNVIDQQNQFSARNALELHRWKEAAVLPIPNERLVWQDFTYWTRAIGAARSGDASGARAATEKLDQIVGLRIAELRQKGVSVTENLPESIDLSEAEAWLAYAEGQSDRAVMMLRSVAERQDARDAEPFAIPAREMLADLLLLLQQPSEALVEYKTVLKMYPNRFNALYGAARSAESLQDRQSAADFYARLISICPLDADRPELQAARKYGAANAN
jgi:tetratricopeptide (TPR) repeat protein